MNNTEIRWKQNFNHYKKSLQNIESVLPNIDVLNELQQDGLAHRFILTTNIALEVMQRYVAYCGYVLTEDVEDNIELLAQNGILDKIAWRNMLSVKDEFSDNEKVYTSAEYLSKTIKFLPALRSFRNTIEREYSVQQ